MRKKRLAKIKEFVRRMDSLPGMEKMANVPLKSKIRHAKKLFLKARRGQM